jgi:hypothetical protein
MAIVGLISELTDTDSGILALNSLNSFPAQRLYQQGFAAGWKPLRIRLCRCCLGRCDRLYWMKLLPQCSQRYAIVKTNGQPIMCGFDLQQLSVEIKR